MAIQQIYDKGKEGGFPYLQTVIVLILLKYFFEQYLNLRQIRYYQVRDIPEHLLQMGINPKHFKRSQKYCYDKLAFEIYEKSIKMSFDVSIILFRFMPYLWEQVVYLFNLDPNSEFQRGLAYIFLEALRQKTIDVPNGLYRSLVILKRYDPNQRSFTLFFVDLILESFLTSLIVPVFLYCYLHLVEMGGDYLFITMQIFVLIITFFVEVLQPNVIAPLFNKFWDLEETALQHDINELAQKLNFPLCKILVMDGSRRSEISNAYFFGFWNKRIVLYDTLLNKMNNREVLSVVGHEIGHWKLRHTYMRILITLVRIFVYFYFFDFFRNEDAIYSSFGFKDKSIFIGSTLFFTLFEPITSFMNVIELLITRFFEFQADTYAFNLGFGEPLRSGLMKLCRDNANLDMMDPMYAWFKNSHPTVYERVKHLEDLMFKHQ